MRLLGEWIYVQISLWAIGGLTGSLWLLGGLAIFFGAFGAIEFMIEVIADRWRDRSELNSAERASHELP